MARDDFYLSAAQQRLNMISAEEQAALADMAANKANNDPEAASEAIQHYANLQAEKQNLTNLVQSYIASQQPPQPEQLTAEERNARPWHKMTPDDALQLAKTSKYGKSLDWNDPHVRAGFIEARNRRARGE